MQKLLDALENLDDVQDVIRTPSSSRNEVPAAVFLRGGGPTDPRPARLSVPAALFSSLRGIP